MAGPSALACSLPASPRATHPSCCSPDVQGVSKQALQAEDIEKVGGSGPCSTGNWYTCPRLGLLPLANSCAVLSSLLWEEVK